MAKKREQPNTAAGYDSLDRLRFRFIETALAVAPELRKGIEGIQRPGIAWADGEVFAHSSRAPEPVQKIARRFNLRAYPWAIALLCSWPDARHTEHSGDPQPTPPPFVFEHPGLGPDDDPNEWKSAVLRRFKLLLAYYLHGKPFDGKPFFVAGAIERLPLRLSRKRPSERTFQDLAKRVVLKLSWREAFDFEDHRSSAAEEYRTRHAAALKLAETIGVQLRKRRA